MNPVLVGRERRSHGLLGYWLAVLAAFGSVAALAPAQEWVLLAVVLVTLVVLVLFGVGWARCWQMPARLAWRVVLLAGLVILLAGYFAVLVWNFRPEWLPHRSWYDFTENRDVTLRLVDPNLVKVENWEILGVTKEVLFVHPSATGTTTLVYPVMIRPGSFLLTDLAIAPEAWSLEGDGVTFLVYVEDNAGIHLLYSQYVDPKHQQQDRRWQPVKVDLAPFEGQLVRIIFSVAGGPAGDTRYDWSGWAKPRLVQLVWP